MFSRILKRSRVIRSDETVLNTRVERSGIRSQWNPRKIKTGMVIKPKHNLVRELKTGSVVKVTLPSQHQSKYGMCHYFTISASD